MLVSAPRSVPTRSGANVTYALSKMPQKVRRSAAGVSVVTGVVGVVQGGFHAQKEGRGGRTRGWEEDGAANVTLGATNVTPYTTYSWRDSAARGPRVGLAEGVDVTRRAGPANCRWAAIRRTVPS